MGVLHYYYANGSYRSEPSDRVPDLDLLQDYVNGYVEFVRVLFNGGYHYMIVNDSGLINGLPRNEQATEIYFANVRARFPDAADPSKASYEAWENNIKQTFPNAQILKMGPDQHYIAGNALVLENIEVE